MKKFLKSLGWSLVYLAIFLVPQAAVSAFASFAATIYATYGYVTQSGAEADLEAIQNTVYDMVMKNALLITIIAGLISVLIFALIFRSRHESVLTEAGVKKYPPSFILPCLMIGVGLCGFVSVGIQLIPFPESWFESYAESSSTVLGGSMIIYFISAVIEAPVVEELTFRGLMYGKLRGGAPRLVAALVVSALFGIVHGQIIWFVYTFLLSLVMIWVLEKTGSLVCTVLLHSAFNLAGFALSMISEISDLAGWCIFGLGTVLAAGGAVLVFLLARKNKAPANTEETAEG